MAAQLDHMTVYTRDKLAAAEFYGNVFEGSREPLRRDFAPVQVGGGLTLNFEESDTFKRGHYAFRVDGAEFSSIIERLKAAGITFGSRSREHDGEVYAHDGRRGFYFDDPSGHGLEVITSD